MLFKPLFISIVLVAASCNNNVLSSAKEEKPGGIGNPGNNPYAHINDIPLPEGFIRKTDYPDSFPRFLRNIELKKNKTVYQFNGLPKRNQSAQFAVLNISVGNKDQQQCADAVMRLRAEYLFAGKQFEQLVFNDNDGTAYKFVPPYTRDNFNKYLERVFGMCGTASLSKTLNPVEFSGIQPGDILIRGGFPGHAVIVMDVAVNSAGEKIYLLAQSYMPAQDIHIVVNPANSALSPWYEVKDSFIPTPEWGFETSQLKKWPAPNGLK